MPRRARTCDWATCFRCSSSTGWIILGAIFSFLAVMIVITALWTQKTYISRQRVCVVGTNERMPPGVIGNPNGYLDGQMVWDVNQERVEYDFTYVNMTAVTGIHVLGPHPIGSPFEGPLGDPHLVLCGMPSTNTCNILEPLRVKDIIDQTSHGASIGTKIREYRNQPSRYFMLIKTVAHPDGAVLALLNMHC